MRVVAAIFGAVVVIGILMAVGCGDKVTLPNDLPKPNYHGGGIDTSYVQVNPVWTEAGGIAFNKPYDVYIGYDQLIYICDTKNNRVVKMSPDGTFLGSDSATNPVAITQDRGLDLLVVAGDFQTFTRIDSTHVDTTTYGNAVYRKRYFGGQGFQKVFQADSPYFRWYDQVQHIYRFEEAAFYGIAASTGIDKEYFVADFWKGRIVRFNSEDRAIPPDLITEGIEVGKTKYPMDLFYYQIAGQGYLAFAQGAPNLGVQVISPVNGAPYFTNTGEGLPPLVRISSDDAKQVVVDELSNFYVLLSAPNPNLGAHHFFLKFDRYGQPLLEFGTLGSGERQFRNPRGMAYHKGIIYIADTGNNRIIRYQLATDVQQ